MAAYFHGNPEIQSDGLQTLILMNPGYVSNYSDDDPHHHHPHQHHHQNSSTANNNFVFLNSTAAENSLNLHHAPPSYHSHHHITGVPLHAPPPPPPTTVSSASASAPAAPAPSHSRDPNSHEISALRAQYNLWNSFQPATAARESPRALSQSQQQGLSLSLSSQQQQPHPAAAAAYGPYRGQRGMAEASAGRVSGGGSLSSPASGITNGVNGLQQSVFLSSKYLKAAQQLLDEVVTVGNYGIKSESAAGNKRSNIGQSKMKGESSAAGAEDGATAGGESGDSGRGSAELSTTERQEIQMKKAKLVGMLVEVGERYKQYYHQMQIVISTFEQIAELGSAKTYTALALETISKQFRCLKDAISGQIRAANKSMGGEDNPSSNKIDGRGSRLKFVSNQLRQQRALQQLGMIQHNAWRPQRGLPERSVSVLRAWLFEHFLHPYPKDSDKHMLAKQTGLTRSQVSNWFINARVRLWKPMVEEMYTEETKEQQQNQSEEQTKTTKVEHNNDDSASKTPTSHHDKTPIKDNQSTNSFMSSQDNSTSTVHPLMSMSTASTSPSAGCNGNVNGQSYSGFTLTANSSVITQGSPKKPSTELLFSPNTNVPSMGMDIKPEETNIDLISSMKFGGDHRQSRDGYSLMSAPTNYIGGFGSYPIEEMGNFDAEQFSPRILSNGVSLTLGLPHCENLSLSGAHHHHQNFLPNHNIQLGRRVEIGEPNDGYGVAAMTTQSHSTNAYEDLGSIQNQKRFAAQLLPDFVA